MTAFTGKEATFFLLAGLIALFGILQIFYNCLKIERIEQVSLKDDHFYAITLLFNFYGIIN